MNKNTFLIFILISFITVSCADNKQKINVLPKKNITDKLNDSLWVKNNQFVYGDIRRYGFLNKNLSETQIESIIELASKGIEIIFPKGVYPINFVIEDTKNITIYFNQSVISGKLAIENVSEMQILGEVEILDALFLKNCNGVSFNKVRLKTDKKNNINFKANRGVNIYSGCKEISINDLSILDCGGDEDFFKYSQASFMIHGFYNTPEHVKIESLYIKNSNRTAAYISGKGHEIGKIEILNYGLSKNTSNIKPVEKASIGEESVFSGLWMNYAELNQIDTLLIRNKSGLGNYSVIFDESLGSKPNIISSISIRDNNPYEISINSNTLVYSEF